jgi:hypothetical protein
MFVATEADAAAIRAVFEQRGEFAAAVELRRQPLLGDRLMHAPSQPLADFP